jgi:transcriptional regulator with XRE-family HTH domain
MLGHFIVQRRTVLGLSQDELARRLCAVSGADTFTRCEISRYERGVRKPRGRTVEWLAVALECGPDQLRQEDDGPDPIGELEAGMDGLPADADGIARIVYEWLGRPPPQIVERQAGRHIGERLVAEIEARTSELRLMDDVVGGRDLDPLVGRELRLSVEVARDASYSARTGRRLLAAVADLAQLAGFVADDAGAHERATRCYLTGIRAGHDANCPELAASALSSLAYQMATAGDPREAVLLASAAVRATPTAPPLAQVLFADRLAWAHGRTGNARGATDALTRADDLFAAAAGHPAPPWAYWLTRVELDVMRGRIAIELGRPGDAVALLTEAVDRYPQDHIRELALYRSYLAEALALTGDRTEARRIADLLAESTGSARNEYRLARIRQLVA